jgi:hypothetical protein
MSEQTADDPAPWMRFVEEWQALDTARLRSEQAVRAEVLDPMLRMLGYGGRTLNEVLYAHPERLPDEYRMVGSKRIEVDYVPTLRLQRFWIMEAKKPGGLDPKAFLQAHFYATHPAIAARYIVLSDGEQIRLYDARATNFGDTRVVVNRASARDEFAEFYQLLAARNLLDAIRRDVLRDVERVLGEEIDVDAPRAFASEIAVISMRVKPLIAENVRQLRLAAFERRNAQRDSLLRSVNTPTLLAVMGQPTEVGFDISNELARRLTEGSEEERASVARAAMDVVSRPARQTVRVFVMRAFLFAARNQTLPNAADLLAWGTMLARSNLVYAADAPAINAVLHLENAVDRIAMKIAQRVLGERATQAERLARRTMPLEELIANPPSRNYPIIFSASAVAARLWSGLQHPDPEVVLKRVRAIEEFERDQLPDSPPHLDGDQILLGNKGREFDFLIRATVDSLYQIAIAAPGLLPDDLAEIGAGWEGSAFPPTPGVPDGDVDEESRVALRVIFEMLENGPEALRRATTADWPER